MDDANPSSLVEDQDKLDEKEVSFQDDDLSDMPDLKKAKSAHPALLKLAASPAKGIDAELQK